MVLPFGRRLGMFNVGCIGSACHRVDAFITAAAGIRVAVLVLAACLLLLTAASSSQALGNGFIVIITAIRDASLLRLVQVVSCGVMEPWA